MATRSGHLTPAGRSSRPPRTLRISGRRHEHCERRERPPDLRVVGAPKFDATMDTDQRLDALVAPLRADVVSGASVVGRMAAEVLCRAAMHAQAGSLEEYRSELSEVSVKMLDAQPAMAPLVTLVRDVLASVEASADLETGRHAAVRAAEAFGSGLELRTESVATRAAALIPSGGTVATISSSSTVRATLTHEGARAIGQVICFESRPMREGEILATALAKAGVAVTFAVDAAASTLMGECDTVLLGADSIGDLGVVNKIGSAGLVDAAMRHEVPVMVVSDETKILPTGFPQHLADDRPPEEVWRAPAGVRVWNRYFEPFELERVTVVVTESAALTPLEVEELRKSIVLPPGLRAWADARQRGI